MAVSAGFDAAEGDEIGQCHVTPACYAHMTHALMALARGKLVVCLEVRRRMPLAEGAEDANRTTRVDITFSQSRTARSRSPGPSWASPRKGSH